jgi:hypothetical protein
VVFRHLRRESMTRPFTALIPRAAYAYRKSNPVCAEKLNPDVVAMKSAKDRI